MYPPEGVMKEPVKCSLYLAGIELSVEQGLNERRERARTRPAALRPHYKRRPHLSDKVGPLLAFGKRCFDPTYTA